MSSFWYDILCFSLNFKIMKGVEKIEKIQKDSRKSINLFEIKTDRSPDYLWDNFFLTIP